MYGTTTHLKRQKRVEYIKKILSGETYKKGLALITAILRNSDREVFNIIALEAMSFTAFKPRGGSN